MKYLLSIFVVITVSNCHEGRDSIINFPSGNKLLYSEFTGLESKRLVLFSIDEQKEYEIPVNKFDGFPESAAFSPDGSKILFKDPNNTDGVHIFDLPKSAWRQEVIPALNVTRERGELYTINFINDTTVVFNGLENVFIISLNNAKLLDHIEDRDTFFIRGLAVNPEENILFLNYSQSNISLDSYDLNVVQYNYKTHSYGLNYNHTGHIYQRIPQSEYLFMLNISPLMFNYKNGEKEIIDFDQNSSIFLPSSRFIDSSNMIILKKSNENYTNNFYFYNVVEKSMKQITKSNTEKTLLDIYYE